VGRIRALALFSLAYAIILELLLVGAVLAWPAFADNLANLRSMANQLPVLGDAFAKIEENGLPGYVIAQHFFKGCNTLGAAAAVLFAAPAVAGEAHRGTLEMWLARPFSRRRILLERYLAGALAVTVPIFVTTLTVPRLAERVDEVLASGPFLWCALHQALFLLAIYSLTFLCSCLGSHPTKISLAVLFVTTFEFAIYMIQDWTHSSLFRMSDIEVLLRVFDDQRLQLSIVGPLLATSALSLVASLVVFQRRNP